MCHPGHCPPCSSLGPIKKCYCGKSEYRIRCGEKDKGKSCGEICSKYLDCNKHICQKICHPEPCSPCKETVMQTCYCGKITKLQKCGSGKLNINTDIGGYFSCKQKCNKLLPCGNHNCLLLCHEGSCGECPFLPNILNTCPCGKIPLSLLSQSTRTKCTDKIATCPNICGKTLSCGMHTCPNICHSEPCTDCKEEVIIFLYQKIILIMILD